ncbi:hypothetical protein AVEN_57779-1, partial [Araneus ventricosus]
MRRSVADLNTTKVFIAFIANDFYDTNRKCIRGFKGCSGPRDPVSALDQKGQRFEHRDLQRFVVPVGLVHVESVRGQRSSVDVM